MDDVTARHSEWIREAVGTDIGRTNRHAIPPTISGCNRGLLDGVMFKQIACALDRDSRKAVLARFLQSAVGDEAMDRKTYQLLRSRSTLDFQLFQLYRCATILAG